LTQKPEQWREKVKIKYEYKRENYHKSYYIMVVQISFLYFL